MVAEERERDVLGDPRGYPSFGTRQQGMPELLETLGRIANCLEPIADYCRQEIGRDAARDVYRVSQRAELEAQRNQLMGRSGTS